MKPGEYTHSAETRNKMSEMKRGKNHPNYGKDISTQTPNTLP